MKLKITATLLACFMLLASLSACGKDKENPDGSKSNIPVLTPGQSEQIDEPANTSTAAVSETTADPEATTAATTGAVTEATTPEATTQATTASTTTVTTPPATSATTTTAAPETFTDCNDVIYVITDALNLRSAPAMGDSYRVGSVTFGQALSRTGYSENWCRVILDGKEYYVSANPAYISTDDPNAVIEWAPRNEMVYVTAYSLYIRETPHTAGKIYDTVTTGTELHRIGYTENWSKVIYDGKIMYCGSDYLSTENPAATTTAPAVG